MKTLYDQLQKKHQQLEDLWEKIPKAKEEEELVKQTKELLQNIAEAGKFIGIARQRENLRGLLRYWSALVYETEPKYLPPQLTPFPGEYNDRSGTIFSISVGTLVVIAAVLTLLTLYNWLILHASGTPTQVIAVSPLNVLPPSVCPDNLWPGTEPAVYRWQSQTNDKQAVMQLKQLGDKFASAGVLELQIDLDSTDEHKDAGEAFIDLRSHSPVGSQAPLNLEGKPITMAVYVPGQAAGTAEQPNVAQIFVKSQINPKDSFKSEYGNWEKLTNNSASWRDLSLIPGRTKPPRGAMQEGFDPTHIVLVGIKIATQEGANVNYSGPIWISDVCWQTR